MGTESEISVDFIAKDPSGDGWKMVLVEQGPWPDGTDKRLRALQERLYGCVDAVLDGEMARKFPDSKNKPITIQLDCYNVPEREVRDFFYGFSNGLFEVPDYKNALKTSDYVEKISFEVTFDNIH